MNIKDIEKLAVLSRISLPEEEKEGLLREMDSILNYVAQVKAAAETATAEDKPLARNVWREDSNSHEGGVFTEILLEGAPERHGQYVKVKKIL